MIDPISRLMQRAIILVISIILLFVLVTGVQYIYSNDLLTDKVEVTISSIEQIENDWWGNERYLIFVAHENHVYHFECTEEETIRYNINNLTPTTDVPKHWLKNPDTNQNIVTMKKVE